MAHVFTLSLAQDLHGESIAFLQPLGRTITGGWELLSISSINSGSPFTIYSGVQQTDAGTNGAIARTRLAFRTFPPPVKFARTTLG